MRTTTDPVLRSIFTEIISLYEGWKCLVFGLEWCWGLIVWGICWHPLFVTGASCVAPVRGGTYFSLPPQRKVGKRKRANTANTSSCLRAPYGPV
ncbi:hypothetical protein, partial [Paraburkholderia sp. C35]|uniref:hypothetical protein n=1 Tax=Paraburkholderia sp. C35 TaxID=2126993 RepID=UPI001951AA09